MFTNIFASFLYVSIPIFASSCALFVQLIFPGLAIMSNHRPSYLIQVVATSSTPD